MLGNLLRIAIICVWLGLTGTHVARYVLPDLGLANQHDPQIALAAHLGKIHHYDLTWLPGPNQGIRQVGTCSLASEADDVGMRLTTVVDITDAGFIPGYRLLRTTISGSGRTIRLRLEDSLDASLRLRAVSISGNIFGQSFSAEGPVDHRGLTLTWTAGTRKGVNTLPDVKADRVGGNEFSTGLLPGMRAGDTFSFPISTLNPVRLSLAVKTAVFLVINREPGDTAAGPAELCEVDMRIDGRRMSRIWCDDTGLTHRQQMLDNGLELRLTKIDDQYGLPLWPPSRVPSATAAGTTP